MKAAAASENALAPGLWGVLATPFRDGGTRVDTDSLRAQVRLYLDLGASGLVALGVFGEGASLSHPEQLRVVQAVREQAPGTPLVIGLASLATAPAAEQGRALVAAAGSPAPAVMVQINTSHPGALAEHMRAVGDSCGVPLVLQDYPVASGVRISAAALLDTVHNLPAVAAIKSEAPPTAAAIASLAPHTNASVFGGLGGVGLLDELAAGAAGVMTGFSHPEGLRAVLDAWDEGGWGAAHAEFRPWLPLVNFEAQPGIGLAIRKRVLAERGLIADPAVRAPAPPLPEELVPTLRAHLQQRPEVGRTGGRAWTQA
ncbi:dihydrodipicolinate synthase family protein [Nocardiopsis salina]|uniref:dihydrodipicolinate synthase family protein n=1 Tax=Nocardiopsis salina TaxID=245836 RepID=UPI000347934A|nr:dihydrodipicolinate synthase family protein [Nocardiopsis salina]